MYKLLREEVETVLNYHLEECKEHKYYDGIIVATKPTLEPHYSVFMRGDSEAAINLAGKIVRYGIDCLKEINPGATDRELAQLIVERALSTRITDHQRVLKRNEH
jgi:hypothetical protein